MSDEIAAVVEPVVEGAAIIAVDPGPSIEEPSAGDLFDEILRDSNLADPLADVKEKPAAKKEAAEAEGIEPEAEPEFAPNKKFEFESADGTKKKMTLAEAQKAFKDSVLMQSDYTKKTTELASERKKLLSERASVDAEKSQIKQQADKLKSLFSTLENAEDPYLFLRTLERSGVKNARKFFTKILNDMTTEQRLPEDQRAAIDRQRRQRVADQEYAQEERRLQEIRSKREAEETRIAREATQQKLDAWSKAAFKDAGLEGNEVESERLMSKLRAVANAEKRMLVYDDFVEAAKYVKDSVLADVRKVDPDSIVDGLDAETLRKINLAASKKLQALKGGAPLSVGGNGSTPKPGLKTNKTKAPRSFADRVRDGM